MSAALLLLLLFLVSAVLAQLSKQEVLDSYNYPAWCEPYSGKHGCDGAKSGDGIYR